MSIGEKFLDRVLVEKKTNDDSKTVKNKDQISTTLIVDSGTLRAKAMMRDVGGHNENDLAGAIADVFNGLGIPGSFINKSEVRASIIEAAIKLRPSVSRLRYFKELHDAVTDLWPSGVPTGGGGGLILKKDQSTSEKDLGTGLREQIAEVLIDLGAPEQYFTKDAPAAIRSSLRRAFSMINADARTKAALKSLARSSRIRAGDDTIGSESKKVDEDLEEALGVDDHLAINTPQRIAPGLQAFVDAAKQVCREFGIPDRTLALPAVTMAMKRQGQKDQSSQIIKNLMMKLSAELQKRG